MIAPMPYSPQHAAAELAQRELARRRLAAFGNYVHPWWKAAAHHDLVAEALEHVETYIRTGGLTGIGRLIVDMPPRHGKTELAAKIFPAWLLGRQPDRRVILTAYGAELAQESSRAVRAIVDGERYQAVFGGLSSADAPVELSDDSRSQSAWDLSAPHRGGLVAAGVGGGITGKGAHLLVIDDPFKNREDAESAPYRDKVMSWYGSTAYTRLEDGGAIVIMHTRWHREDLTGQLLKAMATDPMADQWYVISLPALALEAEEYAKSSEQMRAALLDGLFMDSDDALGRQPGQALWPVKYNEDMLARIKANLDITSGSQDWFALYQQQPRPSEGAFFSWNDFEVVERAPDGLRWMRYCDLALGKTAKSDWNATGAVAMTADGTVFVRDMLRVHEWNEFKAQMKTWMLMPEELGTTWGIENVAFQSLAFQELMQDRELASVDIREVTPEGDKELRARPVQARAKAGKLKLVRGNWNAAFISEALDFPKGRHDDQVDSVSGGLQMIAKTVLVGDLAV